MTLKVRKKSNSYLKKNNSSSSKLSDEINVCDVKISVNQNRLDSKFQHLYGVCPDRDVFCVVSCVCCNMVLKQEALVEHIRNRHSGNFELLTEEFPMMAIESMDNESTKTLEPKAKKQKVDHNLNIESHPIDFPPEKVIKQENYEPLQTSQSFYQITNNKSVNESQTILYSQSFTMPNNPKRRIAHQARNLEPLKIKMKLKKSDHGSWSVV